VSAKLIALHGFSCAPSMWAEVAPEAETPALLGHTEADAGPTEESPAHTQPSRPSGLTPPSQPGESPTQRSRPGGLTPSPRERQRVGGGSGWGEASDQPPTKYWTEVDRLADIVSARAASETHLVGYSMGARVALGLALRNPERFTRLTLIGVNPGLEDQRARAERRAWESRWIQLLTREGIDAFADAWEALPLWQSQRALPPERLARQRAARRAHDPRGLAAALDVLGLGAMPNLWPELPRLEMPIHLIVGERDAKFSRLAERIAARAPLARIFSVPDAGHNPILEAPHEVAPLLHGDTHTPSNTRKTKRFSA
jgi:2-succinyl-6-hydroxy-2,4-cyclohexadiene-1-carboxylate synthase